MLNGDKHRTGGSRNPLCAPLSRIPVPSRIPAPISPGVGAFGRLPPPVASRPLRPLRTHSSVSNSPRDLEMEQNSTPTPTKPMGPPRTSLSRGSVRSGSRGVSRVSANSRMTSGRGSAASSRKDSDQEDKTSTPRLNPPRKPSRPYASVESKITESIGRPVVGGFANVGAVFGEAKIEELHPQIIKMARKSGQLNLSNRGMVEVPDKVYHIHEIDNEEAKKLTMNMSMDNSDDDRWWEQTDLTRLYLASNQLTTIAPKINNLMSLQILDLSDNCLSSLPSTMGDLTCLQRLNLSHNKLEEVPASLFMLPDLRSLQLDHNKLNGLPDDMGNLNVLEYLDVSNNDLTELPLSIGYLQRLSKLNASENKIKELPVEIGDCFGLAQLDLNNNQLTALPESLGNLRKLEQLYARHNAIQVIPALNNCVSLKELHLGNNFIKEIEPDQLNYLTSISVLDLRDNQLDNLPDQITLLQGLERLDVTNNNLSTLPYHLGLLPHLKSVPLEGNPLRLIRRDIVQRGTVQLLKYLRSRVSAPVNTFPGFENSPADTNLLMEEKAIPDKYQMRTSQTMSYHEKASEIPDKLIDNASEAGVRTIDLSKNVLTQVPEKLEMLSGHVSEIMLPNNRLTLIPSWFGKFQRLQFLDVQGNQLSDLPTDLAELLHLREINISANRFEQIPACVYEMKQLEILMAADNKITTMYVDGLSKLERIAVLDLHNNSIDFIPPLLGNMTQLKNLQLDGNPFRVPRRAILDKGTREILDYLRSRITNE
ncbi:LOW QUALITY PROTEIN: leucine-rich repeat-containing protein 40-like [Macrobrachium rosenbergii]|uniref:LOW QUALITY PROTEIN: leucine-rich repeat-containing protein 40-like n=1 Tax=Macrobrachium rosenbergii TaxID=79674 RepID=UPI0034D7893D